jgi:hypothetical protein
VSGIFNASIFNNAIFNTGAASPVVAPTQTGGRVRHKQVRYALRVEGEWLSFASLEDVYAYLEEIVEKKQEEAEEKAENFAGRIISLGRVPKRKPRPPEIAVFKAPQEVIDYVAKINERLERIYRERLVQAMAERAEEDDIEVLLMGVI